MYYRSVRIMGAYGGSDSTYLSINETARLFTKTTDLHATEYKYLEGTRPVRRYLLDN